ncbi:MULTISPECIES: hypothetical protein [Sphingomonas]|uniref:hypothetical protein n=1 Tax=Sphingomonas TaxID=13687 RepID=UPI0014453B01|nr:MULTISPECIES: hypothetical protein [Sphingomonas]
MLTSNGDQFELRHSLAPPITYLAMGAAIQCLMLVLYYKKFDNGFLYFGGIFWLYVAAKVSTMYLYRVVIYRDGIAKRPFGTSKWDCLNFDAIKLISIRKLRPDYKNQNRQLPTSRVEFITKSGGIFSVSLNHFRHEDVLRLRKHLSASRPDLEWK